MSSTQHYFGSVSPSNYAPLSIPLSPDIFGGLTFGVSGDGTGFFSPQFEADDEIVVSISGHGMFLWNQDSVDPTLFTTQCLTQFRVQQNLSAGLSISLVDGPSTGLNFTSANASLIWMGGTQASWNASGFFISNSLTMSVGGSYTSPVVTSSVDTTTGLDWPASGVLGFTASSTSVGVWSTLGLTVNTPFFLPTGLILGKPPLSFSAFAATGFYSSGTNINMRVSGVDVVSVLSTGVNFNYPLLMPVGLIGGTQASYSFQSFPTTGMFTSNGADVQFITAGGVRVIIDAGSVTSTVGLFVDNEFSVTGDTFLKQVNLKKEVLILQGGGDTDDSHSGCVYVAGLGFLASPPLPPGLPNPPGLDPLPYTLNLLQAAQGTFYTFSYLDSANDGEFFTIDSGSGGTICFAGTLVQAIKTNTQASSIQLVQVDTGGDQNVWLATSIVGTWVTA